MKLPFIVISMFLHIVVFMKDPLIVTSIFCHAVALTKEPFKSYRKVGITDGDDILTIEGTTIFLSWLLREDIAKDFKKEVVDPMIKENKDSN